MHDPEEIDINHAAKIFQIAIAQLSHRCDGCVVEDEIELLVSRRDVIYDCFNVGRTRYIQAHSFGTAIIAFECGPPLLLPRRD